MSISATFNYSKGTIDDIIREFPSPKPYLFWTGISASNTEEQKKYMQKLANAKQRSRQDRLLQDLEKIKFHHEHKQRGNHLTATLEALQPLDDNLKKYNYSLKQLVFCETSYLHRHNRLRVPDMKGLDINEAGEKAIAYFGQSWIDDARYIIPNTLHDQYPYQIESWKAWVNTELADKYIQKAKDEYNNNLAFRVVVDKAASDKVMSNNPDDDAFQNGVDYILEEAAKVWGLQEEFDDFNVIVAYPGNLPPAVQYLMTKGYLNFAYLSIEFSSTLLAQKQPKKNNQNAQQAMQASPQNKALSVDTSPNSSDTQLAESPIQTLSNLINSLPLPQSSKNDLLKHVAKELVKNSHSREDMLDNTKELLKNVSTDESDNLDTEKLRDALMQIFSSSSDITHHQKKQSTRESQLNSKRASLKQSIRTIFRRNPSHSDDSSPSPSSQSSKTWR